MFITLNRSSGCVYAQLAEAFRDEAGNLRNRVIATLGWVDKDDPNINAVLAGLARATGCSFDAPLRSNSIRRATMATSRRSKRFGIRSALMSCAASHLNSSMDLVFDELATGKRFK
jgi:hypothetical protein